MLDTAFRAALRNFATLFLLVSVVTVPLHVVYSVIFANVIETRELHTVIETFPEARQVRGVGKTRLTQARVTLGLLTLLELAAIPFLARGAKRVFDGEAAGEVTSVPDALESVRRDPTPQLDLGRAGPILAAGAAAVAIGYLIERTGLLLLEFVGDARVFPFFGLMQGVSRAAGAPFVLAAFVYAARAKERGANAPSLY